MNEEAWEEPDTGVLENEITQLATILVEVDGDLGRDAVVREGIRACISFFKKFWSILNRPGDDGDPGSETVRAWEERFADDLETIAWETQMHMYFGLIGASEYLRLNREKKIQFKFYPADAQGGPPIA